MLIVGIILIAIAFLALHDGTGGAFLFCLVLGIILILICPLFFIRRGFRRIY
ncbi:MAG: hypothetical protein RBG13Loki_2259 [Promethearchaeota archaeon CR_4]|nr:MAG: hypothetical protein RBG13Loki_2259 [Candidatus Lokiarchaeota archaeon CR_4]